MIAPLVAICITSHCTAASNSGTSSIGDRSAAIGVFTEEHASVAQPLFSQAEIASTPKAPASPAERERERHRPEQASIALDGGAFVLVFHQGRLEITVPVSESADV